MNLAATMERAFCAYGDGEWAAAERLCLEAVRTRRSLLALAEWLAPALT